MTKIDEKEILADVRYKAWIITIIVALLILISAGIISLLYRNQREVERKQATESLRKSEENFRHLLDDSPLGVCIVTAKGETIYANKALLDIYGYANVEELNKIPIKERYTPQSYAEFCIRKKARDDGDFGPSEYEIDIVMKNKEIRHLQVLRKQIFWNGAMQFQVIYQDITERKLSEETLKQVKERLLLAIDAGGVGIWDLDIVNNKLFWDDQMFRLYGITPDNFSGAYETWKERVHPEDIERSDSEVQMALRGEKEFDTDFRVVWPNGTIHHIRARARVHRDAANQPTKLIGTNYDITERKLANLKLEKQNKELAFQNEEKEKRAAELVIVNKELEQEITARKQTEVELQQTLESLKKAISATIQAMVSAIEMRDPYTAGHQLRVADLACAIATEMGLSQEKIEGIRMAGSIHDIGKLSIPAEILSKPTKLTNLEFSMIKEHPQSGYDMLKDVKSPWPLAQIVYQHHERMDGTGYPRKLKGDEILLEARIMTVADVVEAMASHRPYRASLGIDVALTEIEKNRGIFYDNSVADACLRLFREKGYQLT
jgi:PAS domain S-box-containing protein